MTTKKCSAADCTNVAIKGGVCILHGAKLKRSRFVYRACAVQYYFTSHVLFLCILAWMKKEVMISSDEEEKHRQSFSFELLADVFFYIPKVHTSVISN